MVEGGGTEQQGEWCQGHRDAVVVVGAETQGLLSLLRQFGLHRLYPIGLLQGEIVETGEMRLHVQSSTGGGHRGIQVGMLGEIEVQGTLFERDLSQDEVLAFSKGADAQLLHPFGDDGVALQTGGP